MWLLVLRKPERHYGIRGGIQVIPEALEAFIGAEVPLKFLSLINPYADHIVPQVLLTLADT